MAMAWSNSANERPRAGEQKLREINVAKPAHRESNLICTLRRGVGFKQVISCILCYGFTQVCRANYLPVQLAVALPYKTRFGFEPSVNFGLLVGASPPNSFKRASARLVNNGAPPSSSVNNWWITFDKCGLRPLTHAP